ncbi:outer membrane protein, heavy metal efflux system [Methylomarinovum caldicuralii]|uniref:Outer membrane protein, heavy metal efflux system n=1 Tax=Methylomarinovum caldicuralii TaxID=438856 RepID=A0AAU9CDD2_9GAMM|nr:TolC family protein [Methylomarinovum caldicuralii]BCX80960.1 outer membrane protein, heavy metal efflux system [Methylomarinovum caldicuralii]
MLHPLFPFFLLALAGANAWADPFDGPLTPAALVREVLARNPDLPAMRAAWAAARARIAQESTFDDPVVSYGFAPGTVGEPQLDFGQTASLAVKLPWPGKLALRGDAAAREAEAVGQSVAEARLALTEAARRAFADWVFVHRALALDGEDRKRLERLQQLAEVRYASGRASRQDALHARVELALRDHRRLVLERRRREVRTRINTLLLRDPRAPLPPPGELPPPQDLSALAQLRARALAADPRLRALAARLEAAHRRVQLARRAFWPDFTLGGGYNSLWTDTHKRLTLGASINIPLPGRRRARLDQARAETLRLEARLRQRRAQVLEDLQDVYDRVGESRHTIRLYRTRLLPLARQSLAAAKSAYVAGSGDFLDLLTAEKEWIAVRLQLARAAVTICSAWRPWRGSAAGRWRHEGALVAADFRCAGDGMGGGQGLSACRTLSGQGGGRTGNPQGRTQSGDGVDS